VVEGSSITAQPPAGEFLLPPGSGAVVLIGGGIGVTPLVAMLHALVVTSRRVVFMHGVRHCGVQPLAAEVRILSLRCLQDVSCLLNAIVHTPLSPERLTMYGSASMLRTTVQHNSVSGSELLFADTRARGAMQ
jgi:ferredoxin-NADP reductase